MSINHERHPKKENSPTITTALQSDNDANERPVREKLRETSIAPKIDSDCLSNQDITSPEKSLLGDYASTSGIVTAVFQSSPCVDGSRGRPGKKRSFDEFERVGNTKITNSEQCKDGSTGHSRKRSREVQKMSTAVTKTPSEHGNEEGLDRSNILLDEAHFTSPLSAVVQPENDKKSELGEEREDLVLGDATFSPRKKRSREQVDTDIQREQKIVATEEAKANRGSDEIQRTEKRSQKADISTEPLTETFTANPSTSPAATPAAIPKEALRKSETGKLNSSSLTEAPVAKSTAGESSAAQKENPPSAPTSKAAFSRSGLAAFSQNSTSGFGELGSSSALRAGRNAFSAQSTDFVGLGKQNTTDGAAVASIGSFGSQEPSAFPTASATGSLGPSPFGAPAFGSAFGAQGTFGSNSAMRSFAASNGDVSLGRSKSKPSTFGAPEGEDEENDDAGSDNEGDGASESGEEAPTSTTKFQQKEVDTGEEGEESIYVTGRSSLYGFADGQWRERGKGVFKLNVMSNSSNRLADGPDHKSARFIMRAHQTHRVLLNTPIFKEMKFGDAKGEEPSNKSITFAVAEEDKLTPYTLKLSDSGEAKALYQTVKTLQVDL